MTYRYSKTEACYQLSDCLRLFVFNDGAPYPFHLDDRQAASLSLSEAEALLFLEVLSYHLPTTATIAGARAEADWLEKLACNCPEDCPVGIQQWEECEAVARRDWRCEQVIRLLRQYADDKEKLLAALLAPAD